MQVDSRGGEQACSKEPRPIPWAGGECLDTRRAVPRPRPAPHCRGSQAPRRVRPPVLPCTFCRSTMWVPGTTSNSSASTYASTGAGQAQRGRLAGQGGAIRQCRRAPLAPRAWEASPGRCECTALAPDPACVDAGGSGARGQGARHALPPASSPAGLGCTGAACRPGRSPGGTQAGHGHRTGAKAGGAQGRQGLLASRWREHVSTRDGEPPGCRHATSCGPPAAVLARHAAAHRHRRALYAVHDG